MKSTKKLLAVILSVVMAFTMVSTSFAAVAEGDAVEPSTEKVEINVEETISNLSTIATDLHKMIGNILAIFDVECPLCKKLHAIEQAPEDTEDTTDVELPSEPSTEPEEPSTEVPAEPEEPSTDASEESSTKLDLESAVAAGKSLYDTIHTLVGSIMGMLSKRCPICDETHALVESEDSEATTEPVTDVVLPTEPVAA